MFVPNSHCRIRISSGASDVYGQPLPGVWISEKCSVARFVIASEKTTVRADSSASRGNAMEEIADLELLLTTKTKAQIDDIVEIDGQKFRILTRRPRRNVRGVMDHVQVLANIWSGA